MARETYAEFTDTLKMRQGVRNTNIDAARELYDMVDKNKKAGYQTTASNDSRVMPDLAIHVLSAEPPKPRIVIAGEAPVEREKFSAAEKVLMGLYRVKEDQYANSGREGFGRNSATIACLTGHLYRLSCIVKDGNTPLFMAENWETKDCYPGWGEREMRRFLHEYEVDVEVAEERAELHGWKMPDLAAKAKKVKISDYYEKRKGRIIHRYWLNGEPVSSFDHKEFDEIPVRGGPMAGGHTILDANAENYRATNKLMSNLLEAVSRAVNGMLVVTTDRGNVVFISPEDFASGEGINKHIQLGEKIESVELCKIPPEAIAILQWLEGQNQRGGLSYALYGGTAGETPSGYLHAQLVAGALVKAGPYKAGLDKIDSATFKDWLSQFKGTSFKPIEVAGNATGKLDGFFHERFAPKDVPDFQYVFVNRAMSFADTRMEEIMMARQALPGQQLLSVYTVLDEILHRDDPRAEQDLMDEDAMRMDETTRRLKMAYQYEVEADVLAIQGRDREARMLRQLAAGILAGPGQQKQPGVVQPEAPPEFGGLNASREDMVRSMLGQQQQQGQPARRAANQGIDLGQRGRR